jgi:hypothetical protein
MEKLVLEQQTHKGICIGQFQLYPFLNFVVSAYWWFQLIYGCVQHLKPYPSPIHSHPPVAHTFHTSHLISLRRINQPHAPTTPNFLNRKNHKPFTIHTPLHVHDLHCWPRPTKVLPTMHYHRHGTRRIPNPALHTLAWHAKLTRHAKFVKLVKLAKLTRLTRLARLVKLAKPKYIQQKASLRWIRRDPCHHENVARAHTT